MFATIKCFKQPISPFAIATPRKSRKKWWFFLGSKNLKKNRCALKKNHPEFRLSLTSFAKYVILQIITLVISKYIVLVFLNYHFHFIKKCPRNRYFLNRLYLFDLRYFGSLIYLCDGFTAITSFKSSISPFYLAALRKNAKMGWFYFRV